jgi:hypothetical protein
MTPAMVLIQRGFVSAKTYNALPTIKEAANVSHKNVADLEDLQQLLAKHNVPEVVSIRLVHKHFDIIDGEAMVFRHIALPAYGTVEVMRATAIASTQLHETHFLVNSAAQLQAYEYTTEPTIDISEYGTFVAEFVKIVVERKLQHKFGLKFKNHREEEVKVDRKEFEFPEEQCTITIPVNLPLPENIHTIDVDTDWGALDIKRKRKRGGPSMTRCCHPGNVDTQDCREECAKEDGMMFDGRIVQSGTPFHVLMNNLMEVW